MRQNIIKAIIHNFIFEGSSMLRLAWSVSDSDIAFSPQPQPSPDLSVCDHFCHICRLSQKTEKWLLTRYNQRSVDIKLNIKKFWAPTRAPEVQICVCISVWKELFSSSLSLFFGSLIELIRAWEHARDRGSHAQYQVGASKILRLVKETNSSNELEEFTVGEIKPRSKL